MASNQEVINEEEVQNYGLPRFIIIGAGSRGNAYARAVFNSGKGVISAVADPITSKRQSLGRKYIWAKTTKQDHAEFNDWQDFLKNEQSRRERQASGEKTEPGVDGAFVCTLDHTHKEIITSLAPLKLHIMSEKPLATTLEDCIAIYKTLKPTFDAVQDTIFSIGHVLRYSPHNMLLHKLLLKDRIIGDILSIEHTEPVGWWHFAHSYVRGNWRKESTSAPSLLTKSCHDIDFLLWLLCKPDGPQGFPHLPHQVSSHGSLSFFTRPRKPKAAKGATNCLSCPHEPDCMYSAKKIYLERHLRDGNTGWPVKIVNSDIEDLYHAGQVQEAEDTLLKSLAEDYVLKNPEEDIADPRGWYGRCVWESDNDVCDNQTVTISWKDTYGMTPPVQPSKTASFHMVAFTEAQCDRRGRVYGAEGEIEYDSKTIRVYNFSTGASHVYQPEQPDGGHGGGDAGLAGQFVKAVADVKNKVRSASDAQTLHIGCSIDDIIRSHAMVFAADEARQLGETLNWFDWWSTNMSCDMN